ncbi:hypothetical protein PANA5342_1048 [Pantoea ananatis LMG 5342]|nr:hypothetical protein PANA5342_1048 [Pantoea ananatis LMG 5342]
MRNWLYKIFFRVAGRVATGLPHPGPLTPYIVRLTAINATSSIHFIVTPQDVCKDEA